jgi:hypothetical protein
MNRRDSYIADVIGGDKTNQDFSIYSSRADSVFTTSCLPEDNIPLHRSVYKDSRVDPPRNSPSLPETWRPIAGETEESSLHNISKQIGKKFSLENLLPPKQQMPSTTEGK